MQLLDLPGEITAQIMRYLVTSLCPRSYLRKRYVNRRFDAEIVEAIFITGAIASWRRMLDPDTLRFTKRTRGKRNPLVAAYLSWRVQRSGDHKSSELVDAITDTAEHLAVNGHDKEAVTALLCSAALDYCGDQGVIAYLHPPRMAWKSTHAAHGEDESFDVPLRLVQHGFDVAAAITTLKAEPVDSLNDKTKNSIIYRHTPDPRKWRAEAIAKLADFIAAAVYVGNISLVRSITKLKVPFHMHSRFFGSPEVCAARRGHKSLYLLVQRNLPSSIRMEFRLSEGGGCLCDRSISERDPMRAAAREGHLELFKVTYLENSLFKPRHRWNLVRIKDAAYSAACGGSLPIIEFIIGQDTSIIESWTAKEQAKLDSYHLLAWTMRAAVVYGHLHIVKAMLDLGVSPDLMLMLQDFYMSISILGAAAFSGYTGIVTLLLDNGAKLQSDSPYASIDCSTPIGDAIFGGWADCIKILLDRGADINFGKREALGVASGSQNTSLVKKLLDLGAKIGVGFPEDALVYMDDEPNLEVLGLLLNRGVIREPEYQKGNLYKVLESMHLTPEVERLLKTFDAHPNYFPMKEEFWVDPTIKMSGFLIL